MAQPRPFILMAPEKQLTNESEVLKAG
jgi:hypothetical protein